MRSEAHITVSIAPDREASVRDWIQDHSLKLTHIELARGRHPRQLMISSRAIVEDPIAAAQDLARSIGSIEGVQVLRVKVEAELEGTGVACLYIEHHVKVRIRPEALGALTALASSCNAHLSRNAFRNLPEGVEERFLTQRFGPDASGLAVLELARLEDMLRRAGVTVLKVERERVLYDDHLQLDRGWLEET